MKDCVPNGTQILLAITMCTLTPVVAFSGPDGVDASAAVPTAAERVAQSATRLLDQAGTDEKVIPRFTNGEWVGEAVLRPDDDASTKFHRHVLDTGRAVGGEVRSVPDAKDTSALVPRADDRRQQLRSRSSGVTEALEPPLVPRTGTLGQIRLQGLESTDHVFTGLAAYESTLLPCEVWSIYDAERCMIPSFAYEHDYKITTSECVSPDPNYYWESNLPGAYRDTRASDSGNSLDFTIGSAYTWLLQASKKYTIRTVVAGGKLQSGAAQLAGQRLSNDAPCVFRLEPNTVHPRGDQVPTPWCFGLNPWGGDSVYYISIEPFTIAYSGTCRRFTFGQGALPC